MSASTNLLLTLLLRLTAGPAVTTSASTNLLLTFRLGLKAGITQTTNLLLSLLLLLGGSLGLSGGLSSGPSGSNCLS
jgi:hypothetical protein